MRKISEIVFESKMQFDRQTGNIGKELETEQ